MCQDPHSPMRSLHSPTLMLQYEESDGDGPPWWRLFVFLWWWNSFPGVEALFLILSLLSLSLQESAVYGDHIWFETNVSGDYCYVGEQHCVARGLVSITRWLSLLLLSSLSPLSHFVLSPTAFVTNYISVQLFFKVYLGCSISYPSVVLFFSLSGQMFIRVRVCSSCVFTRLINLHCQKFSVWYSTTSAPSKQLRSHSWWLQHYTIQ